MTRRPSTLSGPTYRETLGDGSRMYITINESAGAPYEIFVRYDDADKYEWITALTTMITRLLIAGQPLEAIGRELQEIHGPNSGHHIPGGGEWSPSIVARIGRAMIRHAKTANNEEAA